MKPILRLHPLAALPELGLRLAAPETESALLGALRQAEGVEVDTLMRAAVQALLQWQQQAGAPGLVRPQFDAARVDAQLQGFVTWCVGREFGRTWSATQQGWWDHCRKVLAESFTGQPQVAVHGDFSPANLLLTGPADAAEPAPTCVGPVSYDLASLLRDPFIAWEEELELDWAIRYWEQARKAGLPVDEDFGTFWQQFEWTGLQRHLAMAGQICRSKFEGRHEGQVLPGDTGPTDAALLPRLFAYATKVATRYIQLSPLTHLLQDLQGSLVQTGFTLR